MKIIKQLEFDGIGGTEAIINRAITKVGEFLKHPLKSKNKGILFHGFKTK